MKNTEVDGTARRIRSDEIDIWYASPKEVSESNCEEWVQEEKACFVSPVTSISSIAVTSGLAVPHVAVKGVWIGPLQVFSLSILAPLI